MADTELSIGLALFGSGSGQAWILKKCRASIGPNAGAKARFSVNDRVFAIARIEQPSINIAVCNWSDCGWVKLNFFFIKISLKRKVMFLISR